MAFYIVVVKSCLFLIPHVTSPSHNVLCIWRVVVVLLQSETSKINHHFIHLYRQQCMSSCDGVCMYIHYRKRLRSNLYSGHLCHSFTRFSKSSICFEEICVLATPVFKNFDCSPFLLMLCEADVKHGKTNNAWQHRHFSHNHCCKTN